MPLLTDDARDVPCGDDALEFLLLSSVFRQEDHPEALLIRAVLLEQGTDPGKRSVHGGKGEHLRAVGAQRKILV